MPPAQPAADSEPDRNPVLAYADSYRDMAKQGVESVPIWSVITDLERNIAPLYRHAQPVTVVPDKMTAIVKDEAEYVEGWNACRAAMLQELQKSAGAEAICRSDENVQVLHTKSPAQSDCCPAQNVVVPAQRPIDHGYRPECQCSVCKATSRICAELAGNHPVIPDGSTAGMFNSARALLDALYELGPDEIAISEHVTNLEDALRNAAATQSPGSEPATVPGKWIPVSERMPEDRTQVILWDAEIGEVTSGHYSHKTQTFYHCGDAIENEITHWMLPPSAPQGVKP
ncbi:TPA: DUF551 domain-containing protein [Klebsiella pneumoniae]